MNYLMVLPVEFYKVDENTIACEGAFALHLKLLMPEIKKWADKLVILSPSMSDAYYEKNKSYLSLINCEQESVHFIPAFPSSWGRLKYFFLCPFMVLPKVCKAVSQASVIHSGPSQDLFRPFEILAIALGAMKKRNTLFFMDIDHRASADMLYKTGKLSKKSYLLQKYIYDKSIHLQLKFAVRYCTLLLLKGKGMVDDYGKGQANVKNFYDTAHDLSFVLDEEGLSRKAASIKSSENEIRLVYFGRLVEYKGIKDMILALKKLREKLEGTGKQARLTLIGSGEQEEDLLAFVKQHQLSEWVEFKGAIEYGKGLFSELENYDFLLAAPWREDTPRSVFDAFSCGLPIIAYDTYYYKDLQKTGAVVTVPWLSQEKMADAILALKSDPVSHQQMCQKGVAFARENTQSQWLQKRFKWNAEFFQPLQD